MSILGHTRLKLPDAKIAKIRARIEERERAEAVQHVVDGGDLDYGRVSRMEWIATGRIKVDAEAIDALCYDGEPAERVREHVADQVRQLTEDWFATPRGEEFLEEKIAEYLRYELDIETERMEEAYADAMAMRSERVSS